MVLPENQSIEELLLYRDGLMLIINKPSGIPVHAGPKGGPNMEDYFDDLCFGLPKRPSLAHRLDRDTSGCLILGRQHKGLRRLGNLFMQGQIQKTYWAVVEGNMPQSKGIIDLPIAKKTTDKRSWWMEVNQEGQKAQTQYEVLGAGGGASWVVFYPKTGRTHQIRVHSAALGCPIVGDPIYGNKIKNQNREGISLQLHAQSVTVPLYEKKPAIICDAPPPTHMQKWLQVCGYESVETAA